MRPRIILKITSQHMTDNNNQACSNAGEHTPKGTFVMCRPSDAESIKSKRKRMLVRRSQILAEINHGA